MTDVTSDAAAVVAAASADALDEQVVRQLARLAEVYGTEVSKHTISTLTEKVLESLATWQSRALDPGRFPVVVANYVVWSWCFHH